MPDDVPHDDGRDRGVVFPRHDGRRSTSAFGRQVVAAALAGVDDVGARAASHATSWRSDYLTHVRRVVEAGLADPDDWRRIARQGLDAVHAGMQVATERGDAPLVEGLGPASDAVATATVTGTGTPTDLVVPWDGGAVGGDDLRRLATRWIDDGVAAPSLAPAIDDVLAHPDWLPLAGHTVVVCGAASEMGPVESLLAWGATVAAIDLPGGDRWRRLLASARGAAGTLLVPVHPARGTPPTSPDDDGLAEVAGLDLLAEAAAAADWIQDLPGRLVLANTAYADGGRHVRLSAAIDAITLRLLDRRDDVVLSFLATPTDVFVVPHEAVEQSTRAYEDRSTTARLLGRPLRTLTRGRLLARNHPPDADPGIADALVPAQGPNYALAKRIQRWRATVATADGIPVSFPQFG